jgi:hypothetical protein
MWLVLAVRTLVAFFEMEGWRAGCRDIPICESANLYFRAIRDAIYTVCMVA